MSKDHVTEFMNGGRILSVGQISDLSNGFYISDPSADFKTPFSVYIRPKFTTTDVDVVISVKLLKDDEDFADAPVVLNDWSPLAITELEADADLLESYDVYWGAGTHVDKSQL